MAQVEPGTLVAGLVALPMTVVALAVAVACGGAAVSPPDSEGASPSAEAGQDATREAAAPTLAAGRTLSAGEFRLPAAGAFGDPGFHEVLTASQTLPQELGTTAGLRLVLKLWDAGRPGQACSRDHPLSDCATLDWSDSPGRPKVPAGGVFLNSVTLRLASGARTFFLSESGELNNEPDPFEPG